MGAVESVVVLFNLPGRVDGAGHDPYRESDEGILAEVEAVGAALAAADIPFRRAGVRTLRDVPAALAGGPERLVFNLVERLDGKDTDFNFVPAVCAALGRSCTGGDADCLSLTFDKWLTKARLEACGVPAPAGAVVAPGAAPAGLPSGRVIVKPVAADGSEGIGPDSVVDGADATAVAALAARVHAQFGQAALVEQFIEGREFNISVIERDGRVEAMPLAEIDFSRFGPGRPAIVDYAVKWIPGTLGDIVSPRHFPTDLEAGLAERIRAAALGAWRACGCRDYARIDMRVDRAGMPFVLEANSNPDVSPKAGLPAALKAGAVPYERFVADMVANARRRAQRV